MGRLDNLQRYVHTHDTTEPWHDGEWVKWDDLVEDMLGKTIASQEFRMKLREEIQAAFKEWVELAPQLYPDFSVGSFGEQEPLHTLSNVLARAAARAYEGE